jgi:hypothetical protein
MSHTRKLRKIAASFVVAPPDGARVRTHLMADGRDGEVLWALWAHLGQRASSDLACRVKEGSLDAKTNTRSQKARKQQLTAASSSRCTGAITRTTEDAYGLATCNLQAEKVSLQVRIKKISRRVKVPASEKKHKVYGYVTRRSAGRKEAPPGPVLSSRRGRCPAQLRPPEHLPWRQVAGEEPPQLGTTGQSERQWRKEWESSRLFITAELSPSEWCMSQS